MRRIRSGRRLGAGPALPSDLGGYRYTAFGKTLAATAATPVPTIPTTTGTVAFAQPLRWQARWVIGVAGVVYDFRARTWSPELGAFLQPDEFGNLMPGTTLWSWPGQNPLTFRDPSGRFGMVDVGVSGAIGSIVSLLSRVAAHSSFAYVMAGLELAATTYVVDGVVTKLEQGDYAGAARDVAVGLVGGYLIGRAGGYLIGRLAARSASSGEKLLWGTWDDYPEVFEAGREYALIGGRLYTRHAVDYFLPRGLGGRSVSPVFVEEAFATGDVSTALSKDGVVRTVFMSGTMHVVTEQGGRIVVTVNPFRGVP